MDPFTPYSLYQRLQCNYQRHDNPTHTKAIALQHIDTHYKGLQQIYKDGSKRPTTGKTGAAIYDPSGPHEEGYFGALWK
jgi:phage/plasmid primase-like uncharacterized protein